jgi:hypothetical protein
MKKLVLLLFIPLGIIALSPVSGKEKTAAVVAATPTEDSKRLADKQINQQIDNLRDAIAGMRSSIEKGDRASFQLYRLQARTAITEIEKLSSLQVETAVGTEKKAAKEGKMTATPSPTPTPEATPTPTPESTPTPTPEMTPTPETTPIPTPTPTPESTSTPESTPTPK